MAEYWADEQYYELYVQLDGEWEIHFGDDSRTSVEDELYDLMSGNPELKYAVRENGRTLTTNQTTKG
tara:strand:+ start:925 stop:1125 length:201 start_codon:yes stop_codon:yes gene_type:complete